MGYHSSVLKSTHISCTTFSGLWVLTLSRTSSTLPLTPKSFVCPAQPTMELLNRLIPRKYFQGLLSYPASSMAVSLNAGSAQILMSRGNSISWRSISLASVFRRVGQINSLEKLSQKRSIKQLSTGGFYAFLWDSLPKYECQLTKNSQNATYIDC